MPKLAVFDADGVLLDTKIGGFKLLAESIGKAEQVRLHHEEYERRKHAGPWGLEQLAEMFAGISEHQLKEKAELIIKKHLRPESREVIGKLKKDGWLVVAYSSNPSWIMEALQKELGLDDICYNLVEVKDGIVTGKLLQKMDRYGKEQRLLQFMEQHKLTERDVIIVGDSVSDLPMAQHGTFYAFNTDDKTVTSKAKQVIQPPLTNILKYFQA